MTSTYQHLQIGLAGLLTVKQVLEPRSIERSDVIVEGPAGAIHRHSQDAPDALLLDLTPNELSLRYWTLFLVQKTLFEQQQWTPIFSFGYVYKDYNIAMYNEAMQGHYLVHISFNFL